MSQNKFAEAMRKQESSQSSQAQLQNMERGSKHIGGYFNPEVSRQLKQIALNEDTTVQALLGEAIVMLLQSRTQ